MCSSGTARLLQQAVFDVFHLGQEAARHWQSHLCWQQKLIGVGRTIMAPAARQLLLAQTPKRKREEGQSRRKPLNDFSRHTWRADQASEYDSTLYVSMCMRLFGSRCQKAWTHTRRSSTDFSYWHRPFPTKANQQTLSLPLINWICWREEQWRTLGQPQLVEIGV